MIELAQESAERRLLVLAPVGRDAALIEATLRGDAVACTTCPDLESLSRELERGAAAILVTEEALAERDGRLAGIVARQPGWSDLPVLLLTAPGADSPIVHWAVSVLGNVTLLERPARITSLTSAVRSALRARARQYQTRAHLRDREEADRRKDEFLATLAHELRNPLAPIRNAVSLLRMTRPDEPGARIWEMMDRQVSHMVRLVDDLMEVSRITRGKIDLRKDAVDLATVIASAVELSTPLIESKRHELTVSLPPAPLVVEADAMRLTQVFSNLINNAAKYTNPGGRIGIAARQEGEHAVIAVTDNGIGIPSELLPRVFDMFVQADGAESSTRSGLGIGLTLAHSLVEMHGGSLTAHSHGPGGGAEFVVRLPLSGSHSARAGEAVAPRTVGGLPRVLVVDDNQDAAESLAALLELIGAEVRVALDGRAALERIADFRPAAVFLDLGMPGLDGYETAKRIRAHPDGAGALLVALSGWGQEKDRQRTGAAGFDHHLVKPADIDALRAVLLSLAKSS